MKRIEFTLNGAPVSAECEPTTTLLEWIRENAGLKGTKEGCNEGDCGACTVIIQTQEQGTIRHDSINSCIQFLPQIHGKSILTVEGVSGPDGSLHPVQESMVRFHGNQCGFCTPGFIMSMVAAHRNRQRDMDTILAGNLCRCTGYDSIYKAGENSFDTPIPHWIRAGSLPTPAPEHPLSNTVPANLNDFADWYCDNPDATIVAGATDVALWVTKQLKDLSKPCFITRLAELKSCVVSDGELVVGATVTLNDLQRAVAKTYPSLSRMITRFGSVQVRNSATIGGNIANGSPIGDLPPALIALDSKLILRQGSSRRKIAMEDYFLDYGVQDCRPGEFVEKIVIPIDKAGFRSYKISKRFDQDISAVCGCFALEVDQGRINNARIAFGGMAATPKRATHVERFLVGRPFDQTTINEAKEHFRLDYQPISDMRASREYRLNVAQNLLQRYYVDRAKPQVQIDVRQVSGSS